jgi:hypothetical protein
MSEGCPFCSAGHEPTARIRKNVIIDGHVVALDMTKEAADKLDAQLKSRSERHVQPAFVTLGAVICSIIFALAEHETFFEFFFRALFCAAFSMTVFSLFYKLWDRK